MMIGIFMGPGVMFHCMCVQCGTVNKGTLYPHHIRHSLSHPMGSSHGESEDKLSLCLVTSGKRVC